MKKQKFNSNKHFTIAFADDEAKLLRGPFMTKTFGARDALKKLRFPQATI